MPKFLDVEKENMNKKSLGVRLPEVLLRMKILPRIPLKGENSKWWHLSSKYDNAIPSYCFVL